MRIIKGDVNRESDRIRYSFVLEWKSGKRETLWYLLDEGHGEDASLDVLDSAVVAMLPTALYNSEEILAEGYMSPLLLWSLNHQVIPLMRRIDDFDKNCRVVSNVQEPPASLRTKGAVGLGFSGGVDSFSALEEHTGNKVPEIIRVTHLVCNNFSGRRFRNQEWHANTVDRVKRFSKEANLEFVRIDSNIAELSPPVGFIKRHTLVNLAGGLALQRLFGGYLYASGYAYSECGFVEVKECAKMDPALVPALSTEVIRLSCSGLNNSRSAKVRNTANCNGSEEYLDVCLGTGSLKGGETITNCGMCEKCLRTLVALEIFGLEKNFSRVFDLEKYYRRRLMYLGKVWSSNDTFSADLRATAKDRQWEFPLKAKIIGPFSLMRDFLLDFRLVRRVVSGIRGIGRRVK